MFHTIYSENISHIRRNSVSILATTIRILIIFCVCFFKSVLGSLHKASAIYVTVYFYVI